jgi:hypothetical protein
VVVGGVGDQRQQQDQRQRQGQRQRQDQRQRTGVSAPHGEAEKATLVYERGLYLCRQLPTLPHTFACSTIGPAGLNFRVRDGNGWNPRGKITDNLMQLLAISSWPLARSGDADFLASLCGSALQAFKEREDEASQLNRLGIA